LALGPLPEVSPVQGEAIVHLDTDTALQIAYDAVVEQRASAMANAADWTSPPRARAAARAPDARAAACRSGRRPGPQRPRRQRGRPPPPDGSPTRRHAHRHVAWTA